MRNLHKVIQWIGFAKSPHFLLHLWQHSEVIKSFSQSTSTVSHILRLAQLVRQPVQPLIEPMALDCTGCLNIPLEKQWIEKYVLWISRKLSQFNPIHTLNKCFNNGLHPHAWHGKHECLKINFPLTLLFLRLCNPNLSVSSDAVMAFGKSCLFANTNRVASLSSSSCN